MVDAIVRALVRASSADQRLVSDYTGEYLEQNGYAPVDAPHGALLFGDGENSRPVYWIGGQAYAQSADVHRSKIRAAIVQKVQVVQKNRQESRPGEALTSVLCPSCRSVMAKSPVCPRCEKGKQGYKILCSCTECHHEVYL